MTLELQTLINVMGRFVLLPPKDQPESKLGAKTLFYLCYKILIITTVIYVQKEHHVKKKMDVTNLDFQN